MKSQLQSRQALQWHHSHQVQFPNDTPESRYHTAQNTPNLQRDTCLEQHEAPPPEEAAVAVAAAWCKREEKVRTAELVLRLSEVVFCLVSFSVMATDKTQGWSGDSFDRYKEYRYCVSVNVLGCVYSGFQACDMAYQLASFESKRLFSHHLRSHFDYIMDQIVAYLLISASSSAATRVEDWRSNWGKDEFTEKASVSIAMAFLGFVAFAISSLISLYNLHSRTTFST